MGFLFFAWHPPRRFRVRPPPCPSLTSLITALLITPHSSQHYSSHLTHSTTHHTSLITPLVNHTTLSHHSTTHHITPHSSQHYSSHHLSITPRCRVEGAVHRVWQAQYAGPSGGARSCCARGRRLAFVWQALLRAWSPPGPRLAFVWQAQYTGPAGGAAARVVVAWPAASFRVAGALHRAFWRSCCTRGRRLARGWLSCGRRSTQSLLEELLSHHFVTHTIFHTSSFTPLCHTPSFTRHLWHTIFYTPSFTHHLWHTIFYTPSFTHNFVTHHLWHTIFPTIFDTPSVTQLCHIPSFTTPSLSHTIFHRTIFHTHHLSHTVTHHLSHTVTDHLSHTTLSHTIFHTTLSHTIFHTPLCHTTSFTHRHRPSFTHHFVTHYLWHTIFHTTLSHTIFHHTIFVTHHLSPHHLSHTQLCHTPSFLHLLLCLSFLPRPRYNISCSLLEEIDLWGYPVLLFLLYMIGPGIATMYSTQSS